MVETGRMELREYPIPEPTGESAVLRVECVGVCGSDYSWYTSEAKRTFKLPAILGHEVVGRIAAIGSEAEKRWRVREGDLVAVEPQIVCSQCRYCQTGRSTLCLNRRVYGVDAGRVEEPPHLWGGLAQYMYLDPNTTLHRVPDGLSPEDAVLLTPVGNGVAWTVKAGGVGVGTSVVVLGPGQAGLACVLAASAAGARPIVAVGLERDKHRLETARLLGATDVVSSDGDGIVDAIRGIVGPDLADVVVDATGSPTAQLTALDIVCRGGVIVLGGITGKPLEILPDKVVRGEVTLRGVRSHGPDEGRQALALLARHSEARHIRTHHLPLSEADRAIRLTGQEFEGEDATHVSIGPQLDA
jgi:threonine dehydrogenase-like Zn-dependent dehydrogenase